VSAAREITARRGYIVGAPVKLRISTTSKLSSERQRLPAYRSWTVVFTVPVNQNLGPT